MSSAAPSKRKATSGCIACSFETHRLAREQIEILNRDLNAMAQRIAEIADGGDVFPIGVRELCSRLTDDLTQQAQTLMVIMERAPKP